MKPGRKGKERPRSSGRPSLWNREADLIIVGTGFAGLNAALTARMDSGLDILLLEKRPVPGGNSVIAGGGINAVDPLRQRRQGIEDSTELHFSQTIEAGNHVNDREKVRYLVEHAMEGCVSYLEDFGVRWPDKVVRGFGALYERTHLYAAYQDRQGKEWRNGAAIVHALLDRLEGIGQEILFNHAVTRLIREKPLAGPVLGVEVEHEGTTGHFRARKGVILASGGFAANLDWVSAHDPRLAQTGTTNHRGATGECIKYAEDIGAGTVHMDYIQAIPLEVRPPLQAMLYEIESEDLRRAGLSISYRVFVNKEGRRFVDEGARRDIITRAGCSQPLFEPLKRTAADSIGELEKRLALPPGSLEKTMKRYNAACAKGEDGEFGKSPTLLVPLTTGPFVATSKAIMRHFTMGGLTVKGTTGRVLDRWGVEIPGLFAAGEVAGGTHGANRVGHNATPECLLFGRQCARTVAEGDPLPSC